ncbi:MAG: peptidylprolyl isomerase [Opitutales bacterium]|nr:peptidylprolyl isomerase [Opitutales bacterium]
MTAKKGFIILLLATLATAAGIAQTAHNIWDPPFRQGIAAEVEDRIITFEEMRREMMPLIPRIRENSRSQSEFNRRMEELYFEILQNLIDRVIIVNEFRKREFNIPQSVIESHMDQILIEDFDNDRAKFHEYLQMIGKNVREYRRDLREQIIVGAMRGERRRSQSEISPERIERFYSENKLHFYEEEAIHMRVIMLRPLADESPDLMRQQIERVMNELASGRDFAEVAREYSQDNRRERGGDWGWIQRRDLREELVEAAFNLDIGQHSDPVRIGNQTFILYVEDIRDEGIQPLGEVRERIEEILANQLERQSQEQWLERLRRDAYIKYY